MKDSAALEEMAHEADFYALYGLRDQLRKERDQLRKKLDLKQAKDERIDSDVLKSLLRMAAHYTVRVPADKTRFLQWLMPGGENRATPAQARLVALAFENGDKLSRKENAWSIFHMMNPIWNGEKTKIKFVLLDLKFFSFQKKKSFSVYGQTLPPEFFFTGVRFCFTN